MGIDTKDVRANSSFGRVLLVAPSPPPSGGMALQARQLETFLREDGALVSFLPSNLPFPKQLQLLNRLPAIRTVARAALLWQQLLRRVRETEIVHVFAASWIYFFAVVFPAVLVGRAYKKRVVLNYRGGDARRFFRFYGWAARPAFNLADVVTAPSGFLAEVIRNRFKLSVSIVPNILDSNKFRYRKRTAVRPKVLITRNLEKMYDIETALRAFRSVQKRYPEASLWIAGTGSQEGKLRSLARKWNLRHVRFLGQVSHQHLPAIYDQCDILLNASRVDNFPGALIEASAAGLVVISTSAGGIPFIFRNQENSLLVEPGDWQGLAASIETVVESPFVASRLTEAAVGVARTCDWNRVRVALYQAYAPEIDRHRSDDSLRTYFKPASDGA